MRSRSKEKVFNRVRNERTRTAKVPTYEADPWEIEVRGGKEYTVILLR